MPPLVADFSDSVAVPRRQFPAADPTSEAKASVATGPPTWLFRRRPSPAAAKAASSFAVAIFAVAASVPGAIAVAFAPAVVAVASFVPVKSAAAVVVVFVARAITVVPKI